MNGIDTGTVVYDVQKKEIIVNFLEDEGIKKDIKAHLSKEHVFLIPESNVIDDFRKEKGFPKDNLTFFQLALCELYINTGVWVEW